MHRGAPFTVEQLLLQRDFCPSRQFSQTGDVVGCSESIFRRRAEQWHWVESLRARTVAEPADELPSVMVAACKALEGGMNLEATAPGVAGLLEDLLM